MPETVEEYLEGLPADRREAVEAVRATVLDHLPEGFEEGIQYGMISWFVPLARFPDTYNGQALTVASLASQKRHMALYLTGLYAEDDKAWFEERWAESGKKLDMGKSCLRFRKLENLSLEVIAEAIARISPEDLIAAHESRRG